jgi:uncharacterized membrane protein YvbJ
MFCARCGQQIPDASEICPQCGREATLIPPSSPSVTTPQLSNSSAPNFMPAATLPRKRKEVDGWLMFFCILLIVIAPLFVMFMAWSAEPGPDNASYIVWAGIRGGDRNNDLEFVPAFFCIAVDLFRSHSSISSHESRRFHLRGTKPECS